MEKMDWLGYLRRKLSNEIAEALRLGYVSTAEIRRVVDEHERNIWVRYSDTEKNGQVTRIGG